MALDDTWNVLHPSQEGGTGPINALTITGYEQAVLSEIERISKVSPMFTPAIIPRGTNQLTTYAFGSTADYEKVVAGVTPDGKTGRTGRISLTVDELILQRHTVALLEEWQARIDVRVEVGKYHGKKLAKLIDRTYALIGIKAALATSTFVSGQTAESGFHGGNRVSFASAAAASDPGAFVAALDDLFVEFYEKDVDPVSDNLGVFVKPAEFAILSAADALISGEWITSEGNKLQGIPLLKHKGVPIVQSNNLPFGENVTGHVLSNVTNSSAYDVDCTKVRCAVLGADAIVGGTVIPVTSKMFYSDVHLQHFVDSYCSFGVAPRRAEYAGALLIP